MAATSLTERTLKSLPPRAADYFVWDRAVPGFGVRVQPTGRRTFVVGFRAEGSRRYRRLTLGAVGTLTLTEARALARRHLGDVARGDDPASARATARRAATVADVGTDWLGHVEATRKPKTFRGYRSQWNRYIRPALGTRTVTSIERRDIAALHRHVAQSHPVTANRVVAAAGSFFSYCERQGIRDDTPVRKIERVRESGRERFLSAEEWGRLGDALRQAETTGLPPAPERQRTQGGPHRPKGADVPFVADPFAIGVIRFLTLTGFRLGEALGLQWSAIDDASGFVYLSDTKTGASTRPLGAAARALLAGLPRVHGNAHVFAGRRRGAHLATVRRLWLAVRHAAKLEGLRLHDLRHGHASAAADAGQSLYVIGKLLGHRQPATTARYAHLADHPLRVAADETSAAVARAMDGAPATPVTPIGKRQRRRA
jgi:integrase